MHQSGAVSAQCLHNHAFFEESNIAFLQRSFFEILIFFSVVEIYIKMLKISNSWVSVPQMAPYLMFILVCFLDKMHNGQTLQGYVFHMSEILRSATPNLFILTFTQIVMYTRHEKKRALYLKYKMSTIYSKMIK